MTEPSERADDASVWPTPLTPTPFGALTGLKVLDLSRVLAGPYCGQMLGDHGADVIKIESPAGDDTRTWGPYLPDGRSAYYESINRNKRNVCLDLRTSEDRALLWSLIEDADILIENFKVGTMAGWGFDYERDLAKRLPGLIYCRISGFGDDGPLGGLPGYDAALQAYGGLMSINGEADGDPMRIGVPVVDMVTGIFAFAGILLALNERTVSGLGQFVDCTLLDTAISLLHPHSANWLGSGTIPVRTGSAHPSIAPYENFHTRDGLCFVSAANDRQFAVLASVLGASRLARDDRFATNGLRLANVAALRAELTPLVAGWEAERLCSELLSKGVAAAPIYDVAQALSAPQVLHRDLVIELDGYRGIGLPIKLDRTPGAVAQPPVPRGADNAILVEPTAAPRRLSAEAVVRRLCALMGETDASDLEALFATDVIYHNVGLKPVVGRVATIAALQQQRVMFDEIDWRIIHLAVVGETILTERVDTLTEGDVVSAIPVMGTFVVRCGRIEQWRDYFDTALTARMRSGEDTGESAPVHPIR